MEKIIIGLVGTMASGKGTVANYLKDKKNAKIYKFSTALRDVLNIIHHPTTRNNMQKLSTLLRQNFGEDLLAKIIYKNTENDNSKIIIIDGIRRGKDIEIFQQNPDFILVNIEANSKIRYNRLVERNENKGDDKKTYENFLKDEQGEADADIPKITKLAQEVINNNGNMNDLIKNMNDLIAKYEL